MANIQDNIAAKKKRVALYNKLSGSFYEFVRICLWKQIPLGIPDFHQELMGIVSGSKRAVILAPRGYAKSTICSVWYALWCALFEFKKDIIIVSASEGLAIEMLRKIKNEIETNPEIKLLFGKMQSKKWTESHIILSNKVVIRARGVGAQTRGWRPDLIIGDDIETEDSVVSEDQRNKMRTWLFKACLNSLTEGGQFIWIGTVISYLCLIYEAYESKAHWTRKKYQAYIDGVEKEGHELWPELWPHSRLQEQKLDVGSAFFSTEFMNDPFANDEAIIKPNMLIEWDILPKSANYYMAIDPAYTDTGKGDYKIAALVAVDSQGNRYLANYLRSNTNTLKQFIDDAINMWHSNRDKILHVGIPNGGAEKDFFDRFISTVQEKRMTGFPVYELKNVVITSNGQKIKNKTRRITAALQPIFERGQYYIHESHTEAREELLCIGSSKHDDLVDALTYVEQMIDPYMKPIENDSAHDREYGDGNRNYSNTSFNRTRGTMGYGI